MPSAKAKLLKYSYPGNIRELKAIIELAVVMCENNELQADDITFNAIKREKEFLFEQKTLKAYTRDIIKYYLKKNNDDIAATAQTLDIGKSTIYKMMQDGELS